MFFVAQEILVDLSSYPTAPIARNSHDYRPLGLGYANLGSLLMQLGVPYDSRQGRAIAAASPRSCADTLIERALRWRRQGIVLRLRENREPMLRVMRMHRDAAYGIDREASRCPVRPRNVGALYRAACEDWDEAVRLGESRLPQRAGHGARANRNHRPADGLRHHRHRARLRAREVQEACRRRIFQNRQPNGAACASPSGLLRARDQDIVAFISGTNTLLAAPHINRRTLKEKGFTDAELAKVETAIPGVFDLDSAFATWVLGEEAYERLGATKDVRERRRAFSLLEHLGFTRAQIDEASDIIVGRMTIEGAPHLREEHYPVFDCANRCGKTGERFLAPMSPRADDGGGAAVLERSHLEDGEPAERRHGRGRAKVYEQGWRLGLKAVALYRDGCKASQPLSTSGDKKGKKRRPRRRAGR